MRQFYEKTGPGQREGYEALDADEPQLGLYGDAAAEGCTDPEVVDDLPAGKVGTLISGLPYWVSSEAVKARLAEAIPAEPLHFAFYEEAVGGKSTGIGLAIWANRKHAIALSCKLASVPDYAGVEHPVSMELCYGKGIDQYDGVGPLPKLDVDLVAGTTASLAPAHHVSIVSYPEVQRLVTERKRAKLAAKAAAKANRERADSPVGVQSLLAGGPAGRKRKVKKRRAASYESDPSQERKRRRRDEESDRHRRR
eukprot:TRINITY_DN17329_c0_g1_i1.p1 TRINITY_DN17329_c0_g1~~TRINITY_DN17329_c0_g1_i1.p1  ORF type:complete len:253 (+),score=49.38 TRINITY_DN17329_c0_g1_i1:51-809(+)